MFEFKKNMFLRLGIGLASFVPTLFFPFQSFADGSTYSADQTTDSPVFFKSWSPIEIDFTLALDNFRSIPDGSWQGNSGALAAVNFKAPLPSSFSVQLGGSYGLYDWYGKDSIPSQSGLQQQGFITVAASRETEESSGFNAGIAYDWMLNNNFSVFCVNPFFDQIRAQIGYLLDGGNEIGAWASYGITTSYKESQQIPLQFRGISQVNLFWCHYFKSHGYTMLWAGTPYRRGLMYTSGRPGTFTVGAQFSVPLTDYLSVQGTASYMGARKVSGISPSSNYSADVLIGITYSFGKRRIKQSPYMTPANNSIFMSDSNQNF